MAKYCWLAIIPDQPVQLHSCKHPAMALRANNSSFKGVVRELAFAAMDDAYRAVVASRL